MTSVHVRRMYSTSSACHGLVPQDGPAGALPPGRSMVLVAWHRIQLCRRVSLPVAVAFYRWYATPTG